MKGLLGLLLLASFSVHAQNATGKGKNFEANKARALEQIEKHISALQTTKSCISGAQDRAAMKACRQAQKESMKGMRQERKAWRKQRKENRAAKKSQN